MKLLAHQRHIPALDGLRGIAVILVVFVHANLRFSGPFGSSSQLDVIVARVLGSLWVGVDLFFLLSGFLITGILLDAKGSALFFRNFYVRRALRIFPLFYGFLLASQAIPRIMGVLRFLKVGRADGAALALYYYNVKAGLFGHTTEYFQHFWSLCVEEHFYLFWPLIVNALNLKRLQVVCVVAIICEPVVRLVAIVSGAPLQAAYLLTPFRLDGLLCGALIAILSRADDGRAFHVVAKNAAWGFGLIGIWLAALIGVQGHFYNFVDNRIVPIQLREPRLVLTFGITLVTLLFGFLLIILIRGGGGIGTVMRD